MTQPGTSPRGLRAMIRGRRAKAAELRQRALGADPRVAEAFGAQADALDDEAHALARRIAEMSPRRADMTPTATEPAAETPATAPLVSHRDLVGAIAEQLELPRTTVDEVLGHAAELIGQHLCQGRRVRLRDLGQFQSRAQIALRVPDGGRGDHGPHEAPARRIPRWRPTKKLRARLAGATTED